MTTLDAHTWMLVARRWRRRHAAECCGPGCWCTMVTWQEARYGLGLRRVPPFEGLEQLGGKP